jgi:hypothetical protein
MVFRKPDFGGFYEKIPENEIIFDFYKSRMLSELKAD